MTVSFTPMRNFSIEAYYKQQQEEFDARQVEQENPSSSNQYQGPEDVKAFAEALDRFIGQSTFADNQVIPLLSLFSSGDINIRAIAENAYSRAAQKAEDFEQFEALIQMDPDQSGRMDIEEFKAAMDTYLGAGDAEDDEADADMFSRLDKDGDGAISRMDFFM